MATWLEVLSLEIANLPQNEVLEPQTEVLEYDHEVGVATEEMQRLYTIALRWERQAAEALIEARYCQDRGQLEEHASHAEQLRAKSALVKEIFWIEAKDKFSLWDKPSVGVRRGWLVTWSERRESTIFEALGGFFGGQ